MRRRLRARDDEGETLVELLVAIVLLGIAAVAVIGSITMGIKAASLNTSFTIDQNVLRNWAEQIEAMPYENCAVGADYPNLAGVPAGSGAVATVTDIEYWDRGTNEFIDTCSVDQGLQQITLQVVTPAASIQPKTAFLTFVKRGGVNNNAYVP